MRKSRKQQPQIQVFTNANCMDWKSMQNSVIRSSPIFPFRFWRIFFFYFILLFSIKHSSSFVFVCIAVGYFSFENCNTYAKDFPYSQTQLWFYSVRIEKLRVHCKTKHHYTHTASQFDIPNRENKTENGNIKKNII